MANTYTQIYIQLVFIVKGRQNLIPKKHKEEVYKYMTGVIQNRKHKVITINGMPDHVHIFIGLHPAQSISTLASEIKTASTKFIKKQEWMKHKFAWQIGFAVFSYSQSHIGNVYNYITRQEIHHCKVSTKKEYLKLLEEHEIKYSKNYLPDFPN